MQSSCIKSPKVLILTKKEGIMRYHFKNSTDMQELVKNIKIRSDVLGSYTGSPNYGEEPVQDADDL